MFSQYQKGPQISKHSILFLKIKEKKCYNLDLKRNEQSKT